MPNAMPCQPLERRARAIVERLRGTWRRGKGMCCCPAHEDRTPSLSVTLGRKAILFHCFAGCSNEAVIAALDRLGVRSHDLFDGQGVDAGPVHPTVADAPCANARRLWSMAQSLVGSPGEAWLTHRGLTMRSGQLRFLERTPLGPKGSVRFLPAMLAAVSNDAGLLAVHRTFLEPDGLRLARFERPRRALGSLGTGAVRLASAFDGKLGLAEGIETALAAMQIFGVPCWATLGNERFGLVTIPEGVRELHLYVDHDAGGELAERRARHAYVQEGRRIVTHMPQKLGFDWNDKLLVRQSVNH